MDQPFDAIQFVEELNLGAFDGRVNEEITALSNEQINEVGMLLKNHHLLSG
jgi:hypothetical protein